MKALTIKRPWAGLIANRYKTIEVRTWKTKYRGKLAIHVGQTVDRAAGVAIKRTGLEVTNEPTGVIIATCTLSDIISYTPRKFIDDYEKHRCFYSSFYRPGLYGWILTDIKKLINPIPFKGKLGLWNFNELEDN